MSAWKRFKQENNPKAKLVYHWYSIFQDLLQLQWQERKRAEEDEVFGPLRWADASQMLAAGRTVQPSPQASATAPGSRKHDFLQIIVIFPVLEQRNTLGREQRREELCFPYKAWCSFGLPQGPRKGGCADSYQQKHKVLLSPSGKYEFIPRSAEPPRLDANNLVSGSDRTKRTHTSLFTVLRRETRTSSEVHIWSKEWPKQVISCGVPAGGPAGVSLHPGVDPRQNSPTRAKAAGRLEGKLGKGPRGKFALLLPTLPWLHG